MSPKEKADEIFYKLSWAMVPDGQSVRTAGIIKHAKQCAIICVEQIMVAIENVAGGYDTHWEDKEEAAFEYYKEVLEHIKNS